MPASTPAPKAPASPTNAPAGARRGSNGQLFSGLMSQKRGSQDAAAQARRQSFNEMKPAPGFIGSMWNKWTTGHGPESK